MTYYITDLNYVIQREFADGEFKKFAEQMLYNFSISEPYYIDHFIRKYTIDYFVSGKQRYYEFIDMYGKLVIITDNRSIILKDVNEKEDIIITPEHIFYNYKPVNHNYKKKWFRLHWKSEDYWPGFRYNDLIFYSYYKPGNGRKNLVYDERLSEAIAYCEAEKIHMKHKNRKLYKDPWDEDNVKHIHSKSWKETTKRKHQYKNKKDNY